MWWIVLDDFFWRGRFSELQAISIGLASGLIVGISLGSIVYFLL